MRTVIFRNKKSQPRILKYFGNWRSLLFFRGKYCVYVVSNKDQTRLGVLMSERKTMFHILHFDIAGPCNYILYKQFFATEDKAESHCNILQRLPLEELVIFISRHNPNWKILNLEA